MFNFFKPRYQKRIEKIQEDYSDLLEYRDNQERLVIKSWQDSVFSDKYLSVYDRYTLEFIFRTDNRWSDGGLYYNLIIYNQNLEVAYDFKRALYDYESKDTLAMNQRRLELEYWLSLDWRKDEK